MRTLNHSLLLACVVWAGAAGAQVVNDADVCPVDDPRLDHTAWLRSLSLDLRGVPPSPADQARVDGAVDEEAKDGEVEALVDEWLAAPEFAARVVRHHREHLWPNLDPVDLNARTVSLDTPTGVYWRGPDAARTYRGVRNVICLNEPATFNGDGSIATVVDSSSGAAANREGYVEVSPYWDPTSTIRVCAFDAQAALVDDDNAIACDSQAGSNARGCGCGPGMQFCARNEDLRVLRKAFIDDLERRVSAVVGNDESYLELLTGRRAFVNGPLAHFYRHQTQLPQTVRMTPSTVDAARLPNLPFTDVDNWQEVALGAEASGVLTSPAYLLRFQSNRSRANRFFNAWLCQPFQPPASGIEVDPAAAVEPDLQERNGCKYCHALLEPAASHWGRFGEYGANYLSPALFPEHSEECLRCATTGAGCTDDCRRFYVTRATTEKERQGFGELSWYQFRKPEHVQNVDDGPRRLVLSAVVDGRLPDCLARTTGAWLLGRAMAPEENQQVAEWVEGLLDEDFSYRNLVKKIVLSDLYRRVR